MERKILKWTTWCFGLLTVFMCASLYFMPDIKEGIVIAAEILPDVLSQETNIIIDSNQVLNGDKLNIELPDGLEGKDVQITNDYINNTIYVRFAKGVDNYSDNYSVRGSSNHIANLSYYRDGEAGVLEINLDEACEHFYSFQGRFLCVEFKELHEVYDKVVVIDAGHGGKMPGAVKKNIREKDLNLGIVLELKELLDDVDEKKLKVFYTRLEDVNPSLAERVDMANRLEADLFISVHNNASASGQFNNTNGTMILYSPEEPGDPEKSKRLAEICLENVTASTGSRRMGLLKADDIYIVRNSEVPVALIEVGYMTNTEELNKLCDPAYQKKAAQGIYNAIMQAFEEGF